jgi:hypothetical protein
MFMCQRMTIDDNQHMIQMMSCGVIMLVVCVSGGNARVNQGCTLIAQ